MEDIEERINSLYESGEYEKLYDIIEYSPDSKVAGNPEFISIKEECKTLIGEQYIYLIQEQIDKDNFPAASALRTKYIQKYGHHAEIDDFEKQIVIKTSTSISSHPDTKLDKKDSAAYEEEKKEINIPLLTIAIIGVLLLLVIAFAAGGSSASDYNGDTEQNFYSE